MPSDNAAPESGHPNYEDEVLRSLRRIIRAVDLYSRKLISEHGLSGPQLLCLRQLDAKGALPTGHLADAMSLSAATVCGILDRLEARGLLTRERQADDKRRVLVALTTAGHKLVGQAPPPLQDGFLFKLRALPLGQQAQINRTLKNLVSMMSAEGLDAAPMLLSGDPVAQASRRPRAARVAAVAKS
jgi:DNA-binding MarR family transcriptional regulator